MSYTDFTIEQIEDNKVLLSLPLFICNNCGNKMYPAWAQFSYPEQAELRRAGVKRQSYKETNTCDECIKLGVYSKRCDICNEEYKFPGEFAFILHEDPEFPEGETEYTHICNHCIINNSLQVIDVFADSDDHEDLREDN